MWKTTTIGWIPSYKDIKHNSMSEENKRYFGRLISMKEVIRSDRFSGWLLIDPGTNEQLRDQICSNAAFLSSHSGHWIEIEIHDNGFHYAVVGVSTFIVERWMLSETRYFINKEVSNG